MAQGQDMNGEIPVTTDYKRDVAAVTEMINTLTKHPQMDWEEVAQRISVRYPGIQPNELLQAYTEMKLGTD